MRLLYVIQAPAVGHAIFQSLNASDGNIKKVDDLVLVANCMDEQTYIDTGQMLKQLNDQRDLIVTCLGLWWASIGFCGFEALAIIGLSLFSCYKRSARRNPDYKWYKELGKFYKAYLILS